MSKTTTLSKKGAQVTCLAVLLTGCLLASLPSAETNAAGGSEVAHKLNSGNSSLGSGEAKQANPSYLGEDKRLTSFEADPIHLAAVCGGFNSTRNFYVLLKSILFFRTNPIALHLFVDNISQTILRELFATWQVTDLSVNFYNISGYEHEVGWIPSTHYSNRYGLLKLVSLSVLANSLAQTNEHLVLIDTDMLVLGNINQLLAQLENLRRSSSETVFGLVENQSGWYLNNCSDPLSEQCNVWPALGRGFNTGLVLVDLQRFRSRLDWAQLWRSVAEKELISHLYTPLADQDIFNSVLKSNSELVYTLPCLFNVQLNNHTDLKSVCPQILTSNSQDVLKLIHWNSPHKFNSAKNVFANQFRNWYLTFRNWDAKLLENSCCSSLQQETDSLESNSILHLDEKKKSKFCQEIRPQPNERLRTFIFFSEFQLSNSADDDELVDVTLVVHLSLDRLRVLDELASRWQGPISVAIYLSEMETDLLLASIQDGQNLVGRKNIGYHLVFRESHNFNYPINKLRNVALKNAITPYVFLSDIDFMPSNNLYGYLKQTIRSLTPLSNLVKRRRALVVPAFESLQYKFEFPLTKSELNKQINLGSVSMFRESIWPKGHAPTDYRRWRASTWPYAIEWQPEYEPFVVAQRDGLPLFDERFVGFGWNKVEHIMQLAASGYKFIVLPEAFVIHQFHSASYDILKHRESSKYRSCVKQMKQEFLIELGSKYPEFVAKLSGGKSRAR